jgi:hypothetical protein
MPAPTPSTTCHDFDNMDGAFATWVRTILTEVGIEIMRRAQHAAADGATR